MSVQSSSVCLDDFSSIYCSYFGFCICVCECMCVDVCSPILCDPFSSAPGLKPHTRGTGAAGGKARVGGSLDSTPRGVWRRKTPISKSNDVPITHTNTQIVYQEPRGHAHRQPVPAGGFLSKYFCVTERGKRGKGLSGMRRMYTCGVFTVCRGVKDKLLPWYCICMIASLKLKTDKSERQVYCIKNKRLLKPLLYTNSYFKASFGCFEASSYILRPSATFRLCKSFVTAFQNDTFEHFLIQCLYQQDSIIYHLAYKTVTHDNYRNDSFHHFLLGHIYGQCLGRFRKPQLLS